MGGVVCVFEEKKSYLSPLVLAGFTAAAGALAARDASVVRAGNPFPELLESAVPLNE